MISAATLCGVLPWRDPISVNLSHISFGKLTDLLVMSLQNRFLLPFGLAIAYPLGTMQGS